MGQVWSEKRYEGELKHVEDLIARLQQTISTFDPSQAQSIKDLHTIAHELHKWIDRLRTDKMTDELGMLADEEAAVHSSSKNRTG